LPFASYPASICNITQFFGTRKLILDITLCGIWAGLPDVYNATCSGTGPTGLCVRAVLKVVLRLISSRLIYYCACVTILRYHPSQTRASCSTTIMSLVRVAPSMTMLISRSRSSEHIRSVQFPRLRLRLLPHLLPRLLHCPLPCLLPRLHCLVHLCRLSQH